jgi:hypothetical protein
MSLYDFFHEYTKLHEICIPGIKIAEAQEKYHLWSTIPQAIDG